MIFQHFQCHSSNFGTKNNKLVPKLEFIFISEKIPSLTCSGISRKEKQRPTICGYVHYIRTSAGKSTKINKLSATQKP